MSRRGLDYRSYLLRLYRVRQGGKTGWRASLQSPQGGKPSHFGSLSALVDFLTNEGDLAEEAGERDQADGHVSGEERPGCSAAWPWHA